MHDLVGAVLGAELDGVVEHRHEHVDALDRELLLPEERLAQIGLQPLDLREARQERTLLFVREPHSVTPGLDRLAQPDALLVVRDVLDLVRDRPAVRLAQMRQLVGERLAVHVGPEQPRRDAGLELGRQLRDQSLGLEGGFARGLGAERVEARCEVAVHAVGLDQCHRRGDAAEQLLVGAGLGGRGSGRAPAWAPPVLVPVGR